MTITNGNEKSPDLVSSLPRLRSLEILGGDYGHWNGLRGLGQSNSLRRFRLHSVTVSAKQISPLFRAAALRNVGFTKMQTGPEFCELLTHHRNSLTHIKFNEASGFGTSGCRYLQQLQKVRDADLWADDPTDRDLEFVGKLTALLSLRIGSNSGISGATLGNFGEMTSFIV